MTDAQFKTQKASTDCAQAFLLFMSLVGDVERTAHALNKDPEFVRRLADEEGWSAKIQRVSLMSRGQRPGDWERATNRALMFVQAHQLRGVLDKILFELRELSGEDIMAKCTSTDKNGNCHFSAKFLTDLTAAMEACGRISLVALGDTVTERVERAEAKGENGMTVSQMHAAIISGLENLGKGSPQTLVIEQAEKVKLLAETVSETQAVDAGQGLPTSSSENPPSVPAPEVRPTETD